MGLRFADQAGKKWYAACWPEAAVLYQKLGFKFLAKETLDLSLYGGEGKASLTLLTRDPQPLLLN